MIQKTIIAFVMILSFTACQDSNESQAKHDAKIVAEARSELRAELEKENQEKAKLKQIEIEKNNSMAHIGITTNNGKLTIDTNKTKYFFQQMAKNLAEHADKFTKDLEKGEIDNKEAGIEMNNNHINIDIEKTKSFLEHWDKSIEGYAVEFKKITKSIKETIKKDYNATN